MSLMRTKLPRLLHLNFMASGRHAPVVPIEIYLLRARVHKTTRERLHWKPSAANAWGFTFGPFPDSLSRLEMIETTDAVPYGKNSEDTYYFQNALVLGVFLTASTRIGKRTYWKSVHFRAERPSRASLSLAGRGRAVVVILRKSIVLNVSAP